MEQAQNRPTILLDESLHGMKGHLEDWGWIVVTLPKETDDAVVVKKAVQERLVVVAEDEKLLSRCRHSQVRVIDLGFEGKLAHLRKELEKL